MTTHPSPLLHRAIDVIAEGCPKAERCCCIVLDGCRCAKKAKRVLAMARKSFAGEVNELFKFKRIS